MDERIENFLLDVLEDEGKDSNVVRANSPLTRSTTSDDLKSNIQVSVNV